MNNYCCTSQEHCNLCGAQGWAVVLVEAPDAGHVICSECAESLQADQPVAMAH